MCRPACWVVFSATTALLFIPGKCYLIIVLSFFKSRLRGLPSSHTAGHMENYPQDTLPQSFNAAAVGQEITVVQRLENGLPVAAAATSSAETQAGARQWVHGPVARFT
ncbi:hypothetical protein VULLAG_LOCUS20696 [Vulpes lagopus]